MFKTLPLIVFAVGLFTGATQADAADAQDTPATQAKLQLSTIAQKKEAPAPGVASAKTTVSTPANKAEQEESQRPDPGYLNGGYFGE